MIILLIIWFLMLFLLSHLLLVFPPTTVASLPPGVTLLNRSTAPSDSATEKTCQNGVPERERPNRSVVIRRKPTKIQQNHLFCVFFKIRAIPRNIVWVHTGHFTNIFLNSLFHTHIESVQSYQIGILSVPPQIMEQPKVCGHQIRTVRTMMQHTNIESLKILGYQTGSVWLNVVLIMDPNVFQMMCFRNC